MVLTPDTIQAARLWFAENAQSCIDEVLSGEVRVNDRPAFLKSQGWVKALALAGEFDRTLTFLQRAHFIQTGECPALLP